MSVQQEHATSETATLTTTESGGVYQSLFDKINLTPVSSIQEIDLWQNSETLADASPDERVTAAIHVLLSVWRNRRGRGQARQEPAGFSYRRSGSENQ